MGSARQKAKPRREAANELGSERVSIANSYDPVQKQGRPVPNQQLRQGSSSVTQKVTAAKFCEPFNRVRDLFVD
jgi:hypothetical protein